MTAATIDPSAVATGAATRPDHQIHLSDADARASMRLQIARLEQRFAVSTYERFSACLPAALVPCSRPARPRLLTLAGLEARRDELAALTRDAERALEDAFEQRGHARARLEAMLEDPAAHRFERIPCELLGEPGCGAYEARPRLGLLGMLLGWWRVILSSGCP